MSKFWNFRLLCDGDGFVDVKKFGKIQRHPRPMLTDFGVKEKLIQMADPGGRQSHSRAFGWCFVTDCSMSMSASYEVATRGITQLAASVRWVDYDVQEWLRQGLGRAVLPGRVYPDRPGGTGDRGSVFFLHFAGGKKFTSKKFDGLTAAKFSYINSVFSVFYLRLAPQAKKIMYFVCF